MTDQPANENKPSKDITFEKLAKASGLSEDELLRRIAKVLSNREKP